MSRDTRSLLAGRSTSPLTEERARKVATTIVALDNTVAYEADFEAFTRFVVEHDEVENEHYGIVYFGADIYPGAGVVDPNSALSMTAAVAHELSHYRRWDDQTELPLGEYRHLDEAFASLDAAVRFAVDLSPHDIQQLIRDALQRLRLHHEEITTDA